MFWKDLFCERIDEKTLSALYKIVSSYNDRGVDVLVDNTLFTCLMRFDDDIRVECEPDW